MGLWDRFNRRDGQFGGNNRSWDTSNRDIKSDMMAMGMAPTEKYREVFGWSASDDIKTAEISLDRIQRELIQKRDAISLREEMALHIRLQSMRNLIGQSGGQVPSFPEFNYQFSTRGVPSSEDDQPEAEAHPQSHEVESSVILDEPLLMMQRCSLMLPEYGLESPEEFFQEQTPEELEGFQRGIENGITSAALTCMQRFSYIEGNIEDANLKGLGRVTSASFPRLGGVLFGECRSKLHLRDAVVRAIHQTMEAGYLTMLCMTNFGSKSAKIVDQDALWEKWIPMSYNSFEGITDFIFDSVAIESFWKAVFSKLGLSGAEANMSNSTQNPVVDSIGGLATTGATLFLAERVL